MKRVFQLLVVASLFAAVSCSKYTNEDDAHDKATLTSLPIVAETFISDNYIFVINKKDIYKTIPDTIGVVVDSLVGFPGGFGGKTGKDSVYIKKSDASSWPDTTVAGANSITFIKFNNANFSVALSANILVVGPLPSPGPGPTNFAGSYKRTSNGVIISLTQLLPGQYLIENPGGAGVDPYPYILYNYKDVSGKDSLAFPIQANPCHGGLQLVNPTAPASLKSSEYSAKYPPSIVSTSPTTLAWKVFEFTSAESSAVHPGSAQCQWGLAVRTFVKQ